MSAGLGVDADVDFERPPFLYLRGECGTRADAITVR